MTATSWFRRPTSARPRPAAKPARRPFRPRLEALEARTVPSSFLVSNLNDGGSGSLRQAVLDANAHPGADTIRFAPGLSGTIHLTGGELDVTDDVSIQGPGPSTLTVSGSGLSRVFGVLGTSAQVTGLTIATVRPTWAAVSSTPAAPSTCPTFCSRATSPPQTTPWAGPCSVPGPARR
jgi:hypothetical protein